MSEPIPEGSVAIPDLEPELNDADGFPDDVEPTDDDAEVASP